MDFSKFDKYIKTDGKVSKSDIEKFEVWRGYKLPQDFVDFTLKYPGASLNAEFDAEDRPGSMISNFLRFSKEGYSSIYVEDAYEITNFGPYVLFGEDPGGNYLAFDYSNDKLNPSVVFIEHEELGIIEFPDGKSEHDFTEEELDRMMNSEKLEDFPWAIHFVANSFNSFINNLDFNDLNKIELSNVKVSDEDINIIEEQFSVELPILYKGMLKKYGGAFCKNRKMSVNGIDFALSFIQHAKYCDEVNILETVEINGGIERFNKLIPIVSVSLNDNVFDFSQIALKYNLEKDFEVVIIPNDIMKSTNEIIDKDLIKISNEVDSFISLLIKVLEE
ncbi:hypothetical protein GTN31_07165 [Macrococcoides canis]|uniref:SMI1/KNR4 family protein n=1 Tax=Macrococcoides canis TaxID=1855823 RepID=UPI0013E8FFB2|nr:SMI1/KNR4 family protein [Macrococcus canis]QIH76138.1 hypothetical protein GTN31_07165 [Macrococcus canis]